MLQINENIFIFMELIGLRILFITLYSPTTHEKWGLALANEFVDAHRGHPLVSKEVRTKKYCIQIVKRQRGLFHLVPF